MKVFVVLDSDDIRNKLPYGIIAETTERCVWNTGRRKRLYSQWFTTAEMNTIYSQIIPKARSWAFVKGVPNHVHMKPSTILLWQKLGDFCALF